MKRRGTLAALEPFVPIVDRVLDAEGESAFRAPRSLVIREAEEEERLRAILGSIASRPARAGPTGRLGPVGALGPTGPTGITGPMTGRPGPQRTRGLRGVQG